MEKRIPNPANDNAAEQSPVTIAAGAAANMVKRLHQSLGGEYGESFAGNQKDEDGGYIVPVPIVDEREFDDIDRLAERYNKLTSPGMLSKAGEAVAGIVPKPIKEIARGIGDTAQETFQGLTKQELMVRALKVAAEGFSKLEEQAAKSSVSKEYVLRKVNEGKQEQKVSSFEEICLLRSYDVAAVAEGGNLQHMFMALSEGAGTGAVGFWGLPANIALSMLCFFRAVQSVALFYGYDVKDDPRELAIAGDVFSKAMAPNTNGGVVTDYVGKILVYAETATVRKAARQTWAAMVEAGGAGLLIAQMRALANSAAQKAVKNGGKKALEAGVFQNALKQVGSKLALKNVGKLVPVIGAGFGALFDTAQMSRVIEFASLFYQKRFIMEKAERISRLTGEPILAEGKSEK